ncbi:unnamed protein product [marine sediment metagenome]|uniref:Uncharacterized protein n=1 Tax=marine sediment metagenome TaxID=412755 RepID=X0YPT5_9ZZZZ
MADYTLVMRVHLEALDDVQARGKAQDLLEQMGQQEICPDAQLVLRHQGPQASRNLLGGDGES